MSARLALVVLLVTGAAARARAQPEPAVVEDLAAAEASRQGAEAAGFGPEILIEQIVVQGNSWTAEKLIRRALLVKEGERLRAGDPRLKNSRYRVLGLGYFSDVQLRLERGSMRGWVLLIVDVEERGTFTLSRVFFGASEATPVWAGLDLGDANLLGSGLGVGGAFVWAAAADDIPGAERQWALRLRYADPSVLGRPIGVHASLAWVDASEPWSDGAGGFAAFGVRRAGGVAGASFDLTRRLRLTTDLRYEHIDAEGAPAGTVLLGTSHLGSVGLALQWDTRVDPVLPWAGDRAWLVAEPSLYGGGGADASASLRLQAGYERWLAVRGAGHVVSVHLAAGVIAGDRLPYFDRFYVGDWNPLLPPRALDLVVSTRASPDFLGTAIDRQRYGDWAASARLEYSFRLFRGRRRVYGGDLYLGGGVFGLGRLEALDEETPIDLVFDAGLRLDTEIGIFELGLANALGRIPL